MQYKARGFWNKECERAIRWDDSDLAIAWPIEQLSGATVKLSDKDAASPTFAVAKTSGEVFS